MAVVAAAKHADIEALQAGLKQVSEALKLPYCDARADKFIRLALTSSSGNVLMLEGGGIIAAETPNLWAEKRSTQILALWAATAEEYDQLIQGILEWFEQRRGSTIIFYTAIEVTDADDALIRAGFDRSGSMLARRKYGL